jgi:ATP-dependent Clp protease ATP-binding subunit ClpC
MGVESENDTLKSKALEGLKRAFRPEFLNRIDQVVVFNSLSRENLREIVDLLLEHVEGRLQEQQIVLSVGDDVRDYLMQEGYDEEYGARPLRRAIQNHVDDALADAILNGALVPGQTATLHMKDGVIAIEALQQPEPVTV